MNYRVKLTANAYRDIDGILSWLVEHSPSGAATWSNRFEEILESLSSDPLRHSLAPENGYDDTEIRHLIFRTRRGKPYRILFTVQDDVVYVRHLRGSGQDFVSPDDL